MKERQRDARSFRILDQSWLDVKLGLRMLIRYPGLTVIAVLGMSVAIAIAGQRVQHRRRHARAGSCRCTRAIVSSPYRTGMSPGMLLSGRVIHDFGTWRAELASLGDLGAFREVRRDLDRCRAPIPRWFGSPRSAPRRSAWRVSRRDGRTPR